MSIPKWFQIEIGGKVLRESTRYLSDAGYEYCEKLMSSSLLYAVIIFFFSFFAFSSKMSLKLSFVKYL